MLTLPIISVDGNMSREGQICNDTILTVNVNIDTNIALSLYLSRYNHPVYAGGYARLFEPKRKSTTGQKQTLATQSRHLSGTPAFELAMESMIMPQWHWPPPPPPQVGPLPPWRPARARFLGSRPARRSSPGWTCWRVRRRRLGPCTSASRSRLLRWWARGRGWGLEAGCCYPRRRGRGSGSGWGAREMGQGHRHFR